MNQTELHIRLHDLGFYSGPADGAFDQDSKAALLACLRAGPDFPVTSSEVVAAAQALSVQESLIWALYHVANEGPAFVDGLPVLVFEPHRFSRSTGGAFDDTHPALSAPEWHPALYPDDPAQRWQQLLDAVALDVDAAFMSASFGAFRLLGENYALCGSVDPFGFALDQAQSEGAQLDAFVRLIEAKGLTAALRRGDWATFAKGLNGTAFRLDDLAGRLARAHERYIPG